MLSTCLNSFGLSTCIQTSLSEVFYLYNDRKGFQGQVLMVGSVTFDIWVGNALNVFGLFRPEHLYSDKFMGGILYNDRKGFQGQVLMVGSVTLDIWVWNDLNSLVWLRVIHGFFWGELCVTRFSLFVERFLFCE
jgi:hypothetical protein